MPESNNIVRLETDVPVDSQENNYRTSSNISEQARALVKRTLHPGMVRIEQAMNIGLLREDGRQTCYIEHNAEGLVQGSLKERYEGHRIRKERKLAQLERNPF